MKRMSMVMVSGIILALIVSIVGISFADDVLYPKSTQSTTGIINASEVKSMNPTTGIINASEVKSMNPTTGIINASEVKSMNPTTGIINASEVKSMSPTVKLFPNLT